MKTIAELIKEIDMKTVWSSMLALSEELTPEMKEALPSVYKKSREIEPAYTSAVLYRLEKKEENNGEYTFYVMEDKSFEEKKLVISMEQMEYILGVYIPDIFSTVLDIVIGEMYRILIHEYMDTNQKMKAKRMLKEAMEELSDETGRQITARYNCAYCRMFEKGSREECIHDLIKSEAMEQFPSWRTAYDWWDLLKKFHPTEEKCKKLFERNPPALSRFETLYKKMEKDIMGVMSNKKWIVIEKNQYPEVNLPLIYVLDSEGKRQELDPENLESLAMAKVVIMDGELEKDLEQAVGLLFLYYLYPLRVKREIMREQVGLLSNVLYQQAKLCE